MQTLVREQVVDVIVVPQGTDSPVLDRFDTEFHALMEEIRAVAVNAASEGTDIRNTHQWLEATSEGDIEYAVALWFAYKAVIAEGVHPQESHCVGCSNEFENCIIAFTANACPF